MVEGLAWSSQEEMGMELAGKNRSSRLWGMGLPQVPGTLSCSDWAGGYCSKVQEPSSRRTCSGLVGLHLEIM